MKNASSFTAQPRVSNCTILPNEVYQLKLSATALAIYSYLRRLADPETHQCWPSYANIAETFGCSKRTVAKYVAELCEAGLVSIEATSVTTADGLKWNGNLRYTILPIQSAVNLFHERQLTNYDARGQVKRDDAETAKHTRRQIPHEEYVAAHTAHEPEELPP
ncbi:MAG: helix-turn-helix domain-containing protein [Oscillospiraceae bacterium]|nr:helix-turn-helix domain-containing protein [Oscillospiraceae bacterium]